MINMIMLVHRSKITKSILLSLVLVELFLHNDPLEPLGNVAEPDGKVAASGSATKATGPIVCEHGGVGATVELLS